jgi:hypothetical protein
LALFAALLFSACGENPAIDVFNIPEKKTEKQAVGEKSSEQGKDSFSLGITIGGC